MCFCIDRLRTKSEIRIVGRQRSIELAMKVATTKDADNIREAIKRELVRLPGYRSADPLLHAEFRHIKMNLPLECCAKYEEFTVQDTKIDRVSVAVTDTHKTKPQTPRIPVSLCCPVCAAGPGKWLCSCLLPKLRATDVHEQEIFHHSGTEMTNVFSAPNSDISSLMKIWCVGGLCGAHLFKARRIKEGLSRVVLFVLVVMICLALLAITIIPLSPMSSECAKDHYLRTIYGTNGNTFVCERCPSGKTAPAGSTSGYACEKIPPPEDSPSCSFANCPVDSTATVYGLTCEVYDCKSDYCEDARCKDDNNTYYTKTFSTCGSDVITLQADCEEGARAEEWEDTTANVIPVPFLPRGCVGIGKHNLYFNLATSSSPNSCSTFHPCICKRSNSARRFLTMLFGPTTGESIASAFTPIFAASAYTVRSISDVFLINRKSARSSVFFLDAENVRTNNDNTTVYNNKNYNKNYTTTTTPQDSMCFDWMRNKALGNNDLNHDASSSYSPSRPLRRVLVVDTDQLIASLKTNLTNGIMPFVMILVALWIYDFMRLRSFLDSTYIEFASADSFVLLWAKPWECYLKNDHDATQMLDLIHRFNRSHKVATRGDAKSAGGNNDLDFSSASAQQHVRKRIARVRRLSSIQQRKRRTSSKANNAVKSAGSEKIEDTKTHKRRFSREQTEDGDTFFVDETSGESVWELPEGGVIGIEEFSDSETRANANTANTAAYN